MPFAPLGTSSQLRNKSKAASVNSKPSDDVVDKENSFSDSAPSRIECAGAEQHGDDEPAEAKIPHTPDVRIPIEDLIADTEDAYNCAAPAATPIDHVTWQPPNAKSSGTPLSYGGTQRSRKRAHSSSPSSSQQVSAHRDALNLETLNRSLRTPNNDPTQDLWNRYTSANGIRRDGKEPILPAYTHLLPSSPQTPNSKDLRRTHSCGVEWPTSKSKRRKLEQQHSRTKELFAASRKDILRRDISSNTRVGLLLEKIQESMTKKPEAPESPSSSSPLPDRQSQAVVSPTRRGSHSRQGSKGLRSTTHSPQKSSPLKKVDLSGREKSFSEFSDDDLDLEALEVVEQALAQTQAQKEREMLSRPPQSAPTTQDPEQPQQGCRAYQHDGAGDPPSAPQTLHPTVEAPSKSSVPADFDEFDDDDDDDLMNEMVDLAAKFDSQPPKQAVAQVQNTQQRHLQTLDEFDDAFDDDDDEIWMDLAGATSMEGKSPTASKLHTSDDNRAIKRYLIINVLEGEYEYKPGRTRPEKILSVKDERSGMLYLVLLRQSWYDTRCTKGSYVHIIGTFDRTGQCVVDDADNMIILHPDHLISSTVVGDSFTCMRRAVLQDRVKATSAASQPQVYGHILHEIFGHALRLNKWDAQTFRHIIDQVLPSYIESLYEIGVQVAAATEYLLGKTPELMAWACVFVGDTLSSDAVIRDRNGVLVPTNINKLLEVEEHIWSPMYGLKGNIDATVQAQMQLPGEPQPRNLLVPFELKTGKKDNVEQHRVQTALYTLLLSDRYDINVTCGVLYYMETSKTFRVAGIRTEIRHMIIERNELACYVHDKLALPPMVKKQHLCKTCYSKTACFTYHKLSENGNADTSGLGERFTEVVDHLTPVHQEFFKKWDDLLTKEERDTMKFRRELWTMLSSEREKAGRCFSEVVIQPGSAVERLESSKINRFEYTFVKNHHVPGFSFIESQITVGEPIVISDEKGHFNFAAGFVTNVRPSKVVVVVDRRLQRAKRTSADFDPVHNQVFSAHISVGEDTSTAMSQSADPILYRIDKDEFANGMATARNNVLRLMEKDLWRARELRQLIIETKAPEFKVHPTGYALSGPASQQNLNIDQQRAIEKVMSAKDYALVLGMPGTGKTTTIAHIIRALVSQGKSVLLASYTHTAVDNILLKIKDDKIPILRIGAVNKVHPDVQNFADISGVPKKTMEELHKSWHGSKVVATTCLGVNHGVFNARTFDYCIVDEASQITLPICLGPIRMASTFILVGDHYQLPPLVQNKQAQEGGLDVSLFKLLSDAQPSSVVSLEHQYRMAEDIMLLSKELVYSGRIKCGSQTVADRVLSIPSLDAGLSMHHHSMSSLPKSGPGTQNFCLENRSCWLRQTLQPSSRCVFLDTDSVTPKDSARETAAGARVTNATESMLTAQLVTTMIHAGISPRSIGVITFYRSQLAVLKADVKSLAGSANTSEVEMHTADKYQGRDKEIVILSCVRSNDRNHVGDLLKDWRRVNVAVTRAKSKLIILGSKSTLEGSGVPILQGLTRIMGEKGWIVDLTRNVLASHSFESIVTQGNGITQQSVVGIEHNQKSASPTNKRKTAPLQESHGGVNGALTPAKKQRLFQAKGTMRKPEKVVRGNGYPARGLEKFWDTDPIAQDIRNEIFYSGIFPSERQRTDKAYRRRVKKEAREHVDMLLDRMVDKEIESKAARGDDMSEMTLEDTGFDSIEDLNDAVLHGALCN